MTCKKCGVEFKSTHVVNGISVKLFNRECCVDCIPLGCDNKYSSKNGEQLICQICGDTFVYKTRAANVYKRNECSKCVTNRLIDEKKHKIIEILGNKCGVCGYNKHEHLLFICHKASKRRIHVRHSILRKHNKIVKNTNKYMVLCQTCYDQIQSGYKTISP